MFPRVGAGVKPVEGSAVFWYNLHESGDPDKLTLHGACPVLYGTKWGKYVFHVFLAYRNNSEDDTGSAQDAQYLNLRNKSGHGKRCLAHFVLIFEAILCNKKANCGGINVF